MESNGDSCPTCKVSPLTLASFLPRNSLWAVWGVIPLCFVHHYERSLWKRPFKYGRLPQCNLCLKLNSFPTYFVQLDEFTCYLDEFTCYIGWGKLGICQKDFSNSGHTQDGQPGVEMLILKSSVDFSNRRKLFWSNEPCPPGKCRQGVSEAGRGRQDTLEQRPAASPQPACSPPPATRRRPPPGPPPCRHCCS